MMRDLEHEHIKTADMETSIDYTSLCYYKTCGINVLIFLRVLL
jgi:hypothetical protein